MFLSNAFVCRADTVESTRQAFIKHLRSSYPVTGAFVFVKDTDAAMREELTSATVERAKKRGLTVKRQPTHTEMHSRWAWDGTRELLEPLDGGNLWQAFYKDQTALLVGAHEKNFNLLPPRAPYPIRPLNFYFMPGIRTLLDDLESSKVAVTLSDRSLENLADQKYSSRHLTTLKCATDTDETTVLISLEPTALLAAEYRSSRGHLYRRLVIHELQESEDGKAFPTNAEMEIYLENSDKRLSLTSMQSQSLSFPTTPKEVELAMSYVLPAGTEVYDRMLNRVSTLEVPTSAVEIIHGSVPSIPLAEVTDSTNFKPDNTPTPERSTVRWIGIGITCICILALFIAVLRRRAMA